MSRTKVLFASLFVVLVIAVCGLVRLTPELFRWPQHMAVDCAILFCYALLGMFAALCITLYAHSAHEDVRFLQAKEGENILQPLGRWMYEGPGWRSALVWFTVSVLIAAILLGLVTVCIVTVMGSGLP